MSERVIDFHPIAIPSPNPNVRPTDGQTPMSPPGSAIFSQSESDVEDAGPTMKYGSQEDASILYSRPQRWPKTRTLSAVSRFLRLQVSLSTRAERPLLGRRKGLRRSCDSATRTVRTRAV